MLPKDGWHKPVSLGCGPASLWKLLSFFLMGLLSHSGSDFPRSHRHEGLCGVGGVWSQGMKIQEWRGPGSGSSPGPRLLPWLHSATPLILRWLLHILGDCAATPSFCNLRRTSEPWLLLGQYWEEVLYTLLSLLILIKIVGQKDAGIEDHSCKLTRQFMEASTLMELFSRIWEVMTDPQ